MKITINRKNLYTIMFVSILLFDHVIGLISYSNRYFITGNLHPLYFLALFYLIKTKDRMFSFIKMVVLLGFYSIIQTIVVGKYGFSTIDTIINIVKISLCYIVFQYFKQDKININYVDAVKSITNFSLFLFLISLVLKNNLFWRLSDEINGFESVRLKLLYNEPSEVGLHLGMVVVISVALFLDKKLDRNSFLYILCVNLIIIYFAKPMLGLVSIFIVSAVLLSVYCYKNFSFTYFILFIVFVLSVFVLLYFLQVSDISMARRFRAILSGEDSSSRYRIGLSYNLCRDCLINTYGMGVGFSRLTSQFYLRKYKFWGLTPSGITASFFNAIAEFGVLAIGMIIFVVKNCSRNMKSNFCYVALSMLLFILIYQNMGTYFTNPFCWMFYGLVFNKLRKGRNGNE